MENSGRQKFEESWKEAFEDSEMEPSGLVWNTIDQKLDNDQMKRSVLFYQRLAAAAVIFALLIGVASTSYFQLNQDAPIASKANSETNVPDQSITQKKQPPLTKENNIKSPLNTDEDNNEQQELIADAQSVGENNGDEVVSSDNKKQTQTMATDPQAGPNQNVAQANERVSKQPDTTSNPSSAKSLISSAKNERTAKGKIAASSHSSGASVKTTTSSPKSNALKERNADQHGKRNSSVAQPWIAQREQLGRDYQQTVMTSTNPTPIAKAKGNHQQVPHGSIQSGDNAFSRMASYFSPQLKNTKLFKGMEPEPKRELPAMPASLMASARSDRRSKESTWLSFGAAAGSYNPGSAPASDTQSPAYAMQQYATNSLVNSQAPQSASRSSVGSAYSVGLSFGKKIADRWIVHTGVNYMNQAISYTSNYTSYTASNDRTAFVADYADKTSAPLAISQPYKVNSNNEFVSVPVQAGYLIVDRKFGLQWNAGVATDVFLRNTLKDESGRSDKYSQGSGEGSPYRSFNFAALTSTEFSYKLGGQYRVSLVPGVRYSFQSVLKSQTGTAGNPLVLDIGFRFRYIFNTK